MEPTFKDFFDGYNFRIAEIRHKEPYVVTSLDSSYDVHVPPGLQQ